MSHNFPDTFSVQTPPSPMEATPLFARHRLKFYGNGAEYFRIWIVNLALSVITLGLYAPWAKVRAQRYFHANTALDETRFDYHAKPLNILLGRGLLALTFATGGLLLQTNIALGVLIIFLGLGLIPWLIAGSMRFRARMVSWRGVRFSWQGSTLSVYLRTLKVLLLTVITFGIYYFAGHHAFKRLLVDKLQFGNKEFKCHSGAGEFFVPYLLLVLISGVGGAVLEWGMRTALGGLGADVAEVAVGGATFCLVYVTYKVLGNMLSKIVHNRTLVAGLALANDSQWSEMTRLYLVNLVGMVLTLGLYWPWARMREMQYRAEHLSVIGDLSALQGHNLAHQASTAFAEEAAGVLDFDVSF